MGIVPGSLIIIFTVLPLLPPPSAFSLLSPPFFLPPPSLLYPRSPWTNKYEPPLADGAVPSDKLRRLEVEANQAFDTYRELYVWGVTMDVWGVTMDVWGVTMDVWGVTMDVCALPVGIAHSHSLLSSMCFLLPLPTIRTSSPFLPLGPPPYYH